MMYQVHVWVSFVTPQGVKLRRESFDIFIDALGWIRRFCEGLEVVSVTIHVEGSS